MSNTVRALEKKLFTDALVGLPGVACVTNGNEIECFMQCPSMSTMYMCFFSAIFFLETSSTSSVNIKKLPWHRPWLQRKYAGSKHTHTQETPMTISFSLHKFSTWSCSFPCLAASLVVQGIINYRIALPQVQQNRKKRELGISEKCEKFFFFLILEGGNLSVSYLWSLVKN